MIEGNIFDGKLEGTFKYKLNPGTYEVSYIGIQSNSVSQQEEEYIELYEKITGSKFKKLEINDIQRRTFVNTEEYLKSFIL